MSDNLEIGAMGWLPDEPDFRDWTVDTEETQSIVDLRFASATSAPPKVDLRQHCSHVENQGSIGSCTAQAAVGMMEYFQRRSFGKYLNGSRLFVYWMSRKFRNWQDRDTGSFLRDAMKAMVLYGVPPESSWPYRISEYKTEPPWFVGAQAQNYQATAYFRLDPPRMAREELLQSVKNMLARGIPSMFGFTVYQSIAQAKTTAKIPFPSRGDRRIGAHAVMAVGYDDNMQIHDRTGGILIRNSWGSHWGERGYGWLPYDYVRHYLAIDWWSMTNAEWIDTGEFE